LVSYVKVRVHHEWQEEEEIVEQGDEEVKGKKRPRNRVSKK
jgi:hypothetical protein